MAGLGDDFADGLGRRRRGSGVAGGPQPIPNYSGPLNPPLQEIPNYGGPMNPPLQPIPNAPVPPELSAPSANLPGVGLTPEQLQQLQQLGPQRGTSWDQLLRMR